MLLQVTKQLGGVVQGLDKVLASMDLEKVRGICRGVGEVKGLSYVLCLLSEWSAQCGSPCNVHPLFQCGYGWGGGGMQVAACCGVVWFVCTCSPSSRSIR